MILTIQDLAKEVRRMNKSMLVIETPESCEKCQLCVNVLGKHYCAAKGTHIAKGEKDCSCPMVAVPSKLSMKNPKSVAYIEGWNDCRRRILGGSS